MVGISRSSFDVHGNDVSHASSAGLPQPGVSHSSTLEGPAVVTEPSQLVPRTVSGVMLPGESPSGTTGKVLVCSCVEFLCSILPVLFSIQVVDDLLAALQTTSTCQFQLCWNVCHSFLVEQGSSPVSEALMLQFASFLSS